MMWRLGRDYSSALTNHPAGRIACELTIGQD
jgi:hypothetical protein